MSIIKLVGIEKIYGKGNNEVKALKGINLKIEKGDFISIMGSSGCGKSTLLNIIGCIDTPTQGEYVLYNEKIDFKKINDLSDIRNKKISFIFQNFALIKDMTVLNNCILPLRFRKVKMKKKHELAEKYLNELNISDLKYKKVSELSGGQQQRVAIARALVQESNIILADEPTGALDESNSINILNILKELNDKYNKTIVLVTHDNLVSKYSKRKLFMKDGILNEIS
ncbi:ABC transporter ATP-binding protein [Eubacterium multiforme]|uniref:ABC transport system ATP-binding protein n=1 Tax=Eubacterium multiforme TaxID=83339 RepID=A0ABT9UNA2_9FIRM|nr:ABC transporter ATP-binding protein [Eubacterium multiforme]MDQ0148115.1 putative ABC transport system ATP-binding protein [Eubacterium multiforme]